MWDLAIVETGNGGDLQQVGNDLGVVNSIENMPYLGMFGGNEEASTTDVPVANDQSFWGNDLLMKSDPSIQFNSAVERAINNVSLTSQGRAVLEAAIENDLSFLSDLAKITVTVTFVGIDRINVNIRMAIDDTSVKITIINFKKTSDGDWFIEDFNDDFFL